ncbi:hypothetical protein MTR_4g006910 [Medicago truncatula]|uniref:Uncharacterized protein n=1 Tax=Medicago truncatula TaxID=3880 RepID=G7JEE3_MEDTR|nr:hypothetical protein MTR_4g006910 [Medicago truncatula]
MTTLRVVQSVVHACHGVLHTAYPVTDNPGCCGYDSYWSDLEYCKNTKAPQLIQYDVFAESEEKDYMLDGASPKREDTFRRKELSTRWSCLLLLSM